MKDCTFIDLYNYDKDYLIGYNRFMTFVKRKGGYASLLSDR